MRETRPSATRSVPPGSKAWTAASLRSDRSPRPTRGARPPAFGHDVCRLRGKGRVGRERVGGNPLFVAELARSGGGDRGPVSLDEVLWSRVLRLPDDARKLLEVVAVSGSPVRPSVAWQCLGREGDERATLALLHRAVDPGRGEVVRRRPDRGVSRPGSRNGRRSPRPRRAGRLPRPARHRAQGQRGRPTTRSWASITTGPATTPAPGPISLSPRRRRKPWRSNGPPRFTDWR